MRFRNVLKTEWLALALFAGHVLLAFCWVELVRSWWVLALLPAGLLWLFTFLLIIPAFGDARDEEVAARKVRTLVAIPVAIAAVLLLNLVLRLPQRAAASLYLAQHRAELTQAAIAGGGGAAGLRYLVGVPDGGLVIVERKSGRPDRFAVSEQVRLSGEEIHWCERIIGGCCADTIDGLTGRGSAPHPRAYA